MPNCEQWPDDSNCSTKTIQQFLKQGTGFLIPFLALLTREVQELSSLNFPFSHLLYLPLHLSVFSLWSHSILTPVNLAAYQSMSSWNLQFWEVYSLVLNRKRRERWLNKSKWVCLYFIHSTFLWPSSHLLTDHMAGFIFKVRCSFSGLIFWHRHFSCLKSLVLSCKL